MSPEESPTAEGDLQRTPLPHLLVYMADRRLTGVLLLKEPAGAEHLVRFDWGAPVHASSTDGYALFGEILVEAGLVSQEVIDGALATKGLLGDVLILTGHADGETLERMAAWQLERRLLRLFSLPPATSYRYFDGAGAPPEHGGPGARVDLLRLLASGVRAHPRCGMPLTRLMERLGELRLALHPDALVGRFCFTEDEARVACAVQSGERTFLDLFSDDAMDSAVLTRVVYLLLLTRQLDLGHPRGPLGHDDAPPSTAVGRVQLRAALHRVGAAAPDPAGDGERAAVQPRTFRRRREALARAVGADAAEVAGPASDLCEPVSDVVEIAPPPGGRPRGSASERRG